MLCFDYNIPGGCGYDNPTVFMYVIIPMLFTMAILAVAMTICHVMHKRRMTRISQRVPFLEDELKVEQCGDSTLQVTLSTLLFYKMKNLIIVITE